jgi:hypothetical protein
VLEVEDDDEDDDEEELRFSLLIAPKPPEDMMFVALCLFLRSTKRCRNENVFGSLVHQKQHKRGQLRPRRTLE